MVEKKPAERVTLDGLADLARGNSRDISGLARITAQGITDIKTHLGGVDRRLGGVEEHLEIIDHRLETIDRRLDGMADDHGDRLKSLEHKIGIVD